ncbi:MAG: Ig-like domain-containing protein, partial [Propionibacteriaceae bacterium]|nr:Ig-like domain-containing protein [Propionibacteriaceae bacterium]
MLYATVYRTGSSPQNDLYRIDPMSGEAYHVPTNSNNDLAWPPTTLSSAQAMFSISGQVFNDANANGARDASEGGVTGQKVALYQVENGAWTLRGIRQTDGAGYYSFLTSGEGDFRVRLVQPQVNGFNALQTYATSATTVDVDAKTNRVQAQCYSTSAGASQPATVSGPCLGNLLSPFVDSFNSTLGSTVQPSQVPIYSSVHLEGALDVPEVDFGVTSTGSYGDAASGPATATSGYGAPAHVNGIGPSLYLGGQPGLYTGPATDGSAHNATDDGLYLQTYSSDRLTFQNQLFVRGRTYTNVKAGVSGDLANDSRTAVRAWSTSGGANWGASPVWAPTISNGVASGNLVLTDDQSSSSLRLSLSNSVPTRPYNSLGEYYATTAYVTKPWATPGEIEDYTYRLTDSLYRVAATSANGPATFQIDGQSLAATGSEPVFGAATALANGVSKPITVTLPSSDWRVNSVELRDIESGALLGALPYTSLTSTTGQVALTGQTGRDAALQFNFSKTASPDHSTLTVDSSSAQVGSDITATATIVASDGQPLEGVEVRFTASPDLVLHDGANPVSSCLSDSSGQCQVKVTSQVAQTYVAGLSATIELDQTAVDLSGSPVDLTFLAGQGVPGSSSLLVTPASPLTVGLSSANQYTAQVTVRDGFGNLVTGAEVSFSLDPADAGQGGLSADSCSTLDGVCQVYLTSTRPGDFAISAQLADPATGGALANVQGSPATVSFEQGPADSSNSSLVIDPTDNLLGETALATATLQDAFGNPVLGLVEADFSIEAGCATASAFNDAGAGVYTFALDATGPGQCDATVTVRPNGTILTADAQWLAPEPTSAHSSLSLNPTSQVVGDAVVATVTVRDQHDRPIAGLTASDVVLSSDTGSPDVVFSAFRALTGPDQAGQYVWELTSQKVGPKVITATVSGVTLTGTANVQTVTFTAGSPSALTSALTITPPSQTVGEPVSATLSVRDQYDNPVPGLVDSDISLDRDGLTLVSGPIEQSPGRYVYVLTTDVARSYTVTAEVGSARPTASVTFTAGVVDADRSTVQVSPDSQTVGLPVLVTVTARDGSDNPIPGLRATDFQVSGQSDGLPELSGAGFIDRGNGVYTFTMTSHLVGTFLVEAQVAGVVLSDHPAAAFTAGGVCVTNCDPVDPTHVTRAEMTRNDQLSDGSSQDKARVWAFDTYGNPVANAQVEAKAAGSANLLPQTNSAKTGPDGSVELAWTSFHQGIYTAEVTVDGLRPATGILSQIRFTQTQPSADLSQLSVSPAGPLAAGGSYEARVVVRDAQGTALPDVTVSFSTELEDSAEPNPSVDLSNATCLTGADGSCAVQVTSRVAGKYLVSATVPVSGQDRAVTGSPAEVEFVAGAVCVSDCQPVVPGRVTRVQVTQNGVAPDGVQTDQVTVWAYDVYGNAVAQAAVASSTADVNLTVLNPSAWTGVDGTVVLSYSSLRAGSHVADVLVAGETPSG